MVQDSEIKDKSSKKAINREKELVELIIICLHDEREKLSSNRELKESESKPDERYMFLKSVLSFLEKHFDSKLVGSEAVLKKLFALFEKFLFRIPKFVGKQIINDIKFMIAIVIQ